MASKPPIKISKRTEQPSKQELECNLTFPSGHYGPHPRQTTELRRGRETFPSSSSVSAPPTSFVPLHSTFNCSTKFYSSSPAISANLPCTNYELDHEDQPKSLAPNSTQLTQLPSQNSEHRIASWVSASRELHMPKNPTDFEFMTRLADIRRQADGNSSSGSSPRRSSSGSSPRRSLALLGSRVSIASSAFSQSFSVASPPQAVEFPPEPVFTDAIPGGLMQKLELLAIEQTPKAPALKNSYPLQTSHRVTATGSLDTTHKVDSCSSTSSSPNSTTRQQYIQRPAPTKSVPCYTPNPSCSTPPRQTKTPQTTPSSNSAQQPSDPTCAPTATPRISTKPLPPEHHFPPSMISPEHSPPPNKANLKGWRKHFTFIKIKFLKGDTFRGPYRGPFIL